MILMGAGDGGSEATWGNAVPVLKWGRGAAWPGPLRVQGRARTLRSACFHPCAFG